MRRESMSEMCRMQPWQEEPGLCSRGSTTCLRRRESIYSTRHAHFQAAYKCADSNEAGLLHHFMVCSCLTSRARTSCALQGQAY